MSELNALSDEDVDRLRRLLEAFEAGRLDRAPAPARVDLPGPLWTNLGLTTSVVTRGTGTAPGSGTARLIGTTVTPQSGSLPDLYGYEGQLNEEEGYDPDADTDVTVLNLGAALPHGALTTLRRDPVSGLYYVDPPAVGIVRKVYPVVIDAEGWFPADSYVWDADTDALVKDDSLKQVRCRHLHDPLAVTFDQYYFAVRVRDAFDSAVVDDGTPQYLIISHDAATQFDPGLVSIVTQTFQGLKKFTSGIVVDNNIGAEHGIDLGDHANGGVATPVGYFGWSGGAGSPPDEFIRLAITRAASGDETRFLIQGGKATLTSVNAGTYSDSSYAVVNSAGTIKTGAWASAGGLTFCGGLYVSGSPTVTGTYGGLVISGSSSSIDGGTW